MCEKKKKQVKSKSVKDCHVALRMRMRLKTINLYAYLYYGMIFSGNGWLLEYSNMCYAFDFSPEMPRNVLCMYLFILRCGFK